MSDVKYVNYIEMAELVLMKVDQGIFKVHKSKHDILYRKDSYLTISNVAAALNDQHKVCLIDSKGSVYHANWNGN